MVCMKKPRCDINEGRDTEVTVTSYEREGWVLLKIPRGDGLGSQGSGLRARQPQGNPSWVCTLQLESLLVPEICNLKDDD